MIIPVYRVVTSQYPIAAATTIEAGMAVGLDANGYAVKCDSASVPIGLAAETNRAIMANEWTNRITDLGNDTAASGMLSVYHGGGEFWLDLNDGALLRGDNTTTITGACANLAYNPGDVLVVSSTDGVLSTTGGATTVAIVLTNEASLDGGIPGEYEPLSGILADDDVPRTWIKVKLMI